jgi:hypothetical protein
MIDVNNPATTGPSPAPAPTVTPLVEPYSPSGLSPSHAAQWIEIEKDNLAAGRITPEEATRRFDALGATPEQRAPDTRSDEMKQLDAHFPPAKAEDYLIRYGSPGQPYPTMTEETKQFDAAARTWLSAAEFPRELGNSLITQIERTGRATKGMTPDELITYGETEFVKLQRAYGPALEEKLRAAVVMIEAVEKKTPGLKTLLNSHGIFDNAMIANLLIQQSERWHARRKGR